MKPSYEQLEAELTATKIELAETKRLLETTTDLLKKALEEIADLKEKLNLNSKNSSKPPSTDQKSITSLLKEGIANTSTKQLGGILVKDAMHGSQVVLWERFLSYTPIEVAKLSKSW